MYVNKSNGIINLVTNIPADDEIVIKDDKGVTKFRLEYDVLPTISKYGASYDKIVDGNAAFSIGDVRLGEDISEDYIAAFVRKAVENLPEEDLVLEAAAQASYKATIDAKVQSIMNATN